MSDERLLAFSRALADSVRSALPVAETLRNLGFPDAADGVAQGKPLHEALAPRGGLPPILIALIRAGEESGKVDAFLDRYSAALETRIDFRRRLNRALIYPCFAGLLAAALFLAFATKAAPMLLAPILDAGAPVPPAALKLIAVGAWIVEHLIWILGGLFAAGLLLRAAAGSLPGRMMRSLAGHWVPGVRFATAEARHYQFEATLELLLGAGLRPRQIMEIMVQYCEDDLIVRRRLKRGAALLESGKTFSESLGPCLPPEDLTRFSVAEKAGRLDETLGKLAVEHRERHLHRLKQAATAIQLSATVALAPLCFGLIMAILWPTLSMMRAAVSPLAGAGSALPENGAPGGFPALPPLPAEKERAAQSASASRFNESNAKNILGYMDAHKPRGEDEAALTGAEEASSPAKKKKMQKIGLKASTFQRLPQNRIEATRVKSSLSD